VNTGFRHSVELVGADVHGHEDEETRYVLLCRHARHDDGELVASKDGNGLWRFPTESVARALAEELVIGDDRLRLAKVICAPTPEAARTANLILLRLRGEIRKASSEPPDQPDREPIRKVTVCAPEWLPESDAALGACGYGVACDPCNDLLPSRLGETWSGAVATIDNEIAQLGGDKGDNALLIVGHQPQLGWISGYLSARRPRGWSSGAVPLAPSELVCLRLTRARAKDQWRGSLAWTLAPDDREALAAVSDKVRGKMESAKLLSAVITLAITALLGVLLNESLWAGLATPNASLAGLSYCARAAVQVGFVLLIAALALYLLSMYSYDRILMPPRFWAEGPDRTREETGPGASRRRPVIRRLIQRRTRGSWLPRRPPSSSAWVVYRNMQRIWFWLFTPANILVGLAFAVLGSALLRVHGWAWLPVVLFALAMGAWSWWFRPVLGSED
jgi:hypothetical protein